MTSLEEAKLGAHTNLAHTTARCTTSSNGERTLRVFFTLPCRGRVGERSAPGWGPSLREVGACCGTPLRRPSGAPTLPLQGRVKTARIGVAAVPVSMTCQTRLSEGTTLA